ncbi:unnamed protein product, partial [Prorocentrum cordatum]
APPRRWPARAPARASPSAGAASWAGCRRRPRGSWSASRSRRSWARRRSPAAGRSCSRT